MGRPITTSQGGTPAIAGRRNKDLRPQRRSRVCPSCRESSLTANRARSAGAMAQDRSDAHGRAGSRAMAACTGGRRVSGATAQRHGPVRV